MRPTSSVRLPSTRLRSSLVSLAHFCCTLPFICFQFPSTRSQFIIISLLQAPRPRSSDRTQKQDVAGGNPATSRVAGRARGEGMRPVLAISLRRKRSSSRIGGKIPTRPGIFAPRQTETIRFGSAFPVGEISRDLGLREPPATLTVAFEQKGSFAPAGAVGGRIVRQFAVPRDPRSESRSLPGPLDERRFGLAVWNRRRNAAPRRCGGAVGPAHCADRGRPDPRRELSCHSRGGDLVAPPPRRPRSQPSDAGVPDRRLPCAQRRA